MKILIIENEYDSIKPIFDAVERIVLKKQIQKEVVAKSQDISWDTLTSYTAIFVDISLAVKSELDGYGILNKIFIEYPQIKDRVAIITGNDKIKEMLDNRSLGEWNIRIFSKPLRYRDIADFIAKSVR